VLQQGRGVVLLAGAERSSAASLRRKHALRSNVGHKLDALLLAQWNNGVLEFSRYAITPGALTQGRFPAVLRAERGRAPLRRARSAARRRARSQDDDTSRTRPGVTIAANGFDRRYAVLRHTAPSLSHIHIRHHVYGH
jgi:hypothetical protein